MGHEALKLELIEWLTKLEDKDTIDYLKIVKDSSTSGKDWWHDLNEQQKYSIQQGLKNIEDGRLTTHEDIKKKYGL